MELAIVGGVAMVFLFAGGENPPPYGFPRVLAAVVNPLSALLAAVFLIFVVMFLYTPFRDHRKVVRERNSAQGHTSEVQEEYDKFRRTLNLHVHSYTWGRHMDGTVLHELRQMRTGHASMTTTGLQRVWRNTHGQVDNAREWLRRLGQPTLADELPVLPDEPPADLDECIVLAEEVRLCFSRWAQITTDLPPFSGDATDAGLHPPDINEMWAAATESQS